MRCKAVTSNLLTVVGLIVEPRIAIEKIKGYIEAFIYMIQTPITVTSINLANPPHLSSFLFFSSMLISNSRSHQSIGKQWSTVENYVENSADLCGSRNRTEKMRCTESRKCLSSIDIIKGGYVLFRGPSISWKSIVEAIYSKLFWWLSDTDQFVIVLSLNPTTK